MSAPAGADLAVAIVGAGGRLGSFAARLVSSTPGMRLVAGYGSRDDWPSAVRACGADVVLECTRAGLGAEHARLLIEAGLRPVVATSGVSEEDVRELDALARARHCGGLVVANFSLGSVLLQHLCAEAARYFPDVEIIERHHPRKVDAPSGTAVETARRIALARELARAGGGPQTETGAVAGAPSDARGPATPAPARGGQHHGVRVHSLRLPGSYAHQEVRFGAQGESLCLAHDMGGPDAFAAGIVAALWDARRRLGVARGLTLEHFGAPG